jgi:hypothetical protein
LRGGVHRIRGVPPFGRRRRLNDDKLTSAGNLASLAVIDNAPNYRVTRRPSIAAALLVFQPNYVIHVAADRSTATTR